MRMYDLIMKKRNGHSLSKDEIQFMISHYTDGDIPDYQMSAMMMAVFFQGTKKKRCSLPWQWQRVVKCWIYPAFTVSK